MSCAFFGGSAVGRSSGRRECGVAEEPRTRGFAAPAFAGVCLCRGIANTSLRKLPGSRSLAVISL
jgi:hypothetical protein